MQTRNVHTAFTLNEGPEKSTVFGLGPKVFTDAQAAHWFVQQNTDAPGPNAVTVDSEDNVALITALNARISSLTDELKLTNTHDEATSKELDALRPAYTAAIADRDNLTGIARAAETRASSLQVELDASNKARDEALAKVAELQTALDAATAPQDPDRDKDVAEASETGQPDTSADTGADASGATSESSDDAAKAASKAKGRPAGTTDE